jgi:hypothetical protein
MTTYKGGCKCAAGAIQADGEIERFDGAKLQRLDGRENMFLFCSMDR